MRKTIVLGALLAVSIAAAPARAADGSITFARWEADGYCYPCTIEKEEDGKDYIRYTDGTKEWAPAWRIGKANIRVGDTVYGNWLNKGLYYEGKVTSRDGDNIHILYTDGDEEDTTIGLIRMKLECPDAKEVGCRVFGRWAPDGYWYPGTVKEKKDGKYLVRFDDSDKAWLDENEVAGYQPTFGDHIQGNWLGKGIFYSGRVAKRNGEKVRIEYDDGDVENTTISYLRADYDGRFHPAK
ncbi:MAG TPA: agenet domain-containing protein [Gemmataceae bacterium]|nr:agenet domain-containing protein [Gemmataceae bacterium]